MSDRIADREAETAILGAVLLAGGAPCSLHLELMGLGLDAESFDDPRHAVIWTAMCAITRRGGSVDVITLAAELRAMQRLNTVGGAQAIGDLYDYIPTIAHAPQHAEIVLDMARLRRAATIATTMLARIAQGGRPPDILSDVRALAARIPTGERTGARSEMSHHAAKAFEELERVAAAKAAGRMTVARFGVDVLDGSDEWEGKLGGIFAQNVLVLSGVPGAGKTTLAWQAVEASATPEAPVLVFSTEMRGPQLVARLAAARAGLDFKRVRGGTLSQYEMDSYGAQLGRIAGLPARIIDTEVNGGRLSADDVRAHTLAATAKGRVGLVLVDYFQDLAPLRGRERLSATEEQVERAAVLHDTAVSGDVPMLLVSSMTKEAQTAQGRDGKRATTADARGAGLDYAADTMAFLTRRDDETGPVRRVQFEITKNRYGETGSVDLLFDMPRGRFAGSVRRTSGAVQPFDDDGSPWAQEAAE